MIKSQTRKLIDKYGEQQITKTIKKMTNHVRTASIVVECGICESKGCNVCK